MIPSYTEFTRIIYYTSTPSMLISLASISTWHPTLLQFQSRSFNRLWIDWLGSQLLATVDTYIHTYILTWHIDHILHITYCKCKYILLYISTYMIAMTYDELNTDNTCMLTLTSYSSRLYTSDLNHAYIQHNTWYIHTWDPFHTLHIHDIST